MRGNFQKSVPWFAEASLRKNFSVGRLTVHFQKLNLLPTFKSLILSQGGRRFIFFKK